MKQFSIIFFAFLLISGGAFAQQMHFGIKGGLNAYTVHESSAYYHYKTLAGFHAGVFGNLTLSKKLSGQAEILYSTQGGRFFESPVGGTVVYSIPVRLRLDYINIPLLLHFACIKNIQIEAGFQMGILISSEIKYQHNEGNINTNDEYKRGEFSFITGINYNISHTRLGINARYNLGLSNINEYETNNSFPKTTEKNSNRGGQIGIIYLFKHK